jgi:hypothetical protein
MKRDVFGIYSNVSKTYVAKRPAGICPTCQKPMLPGETLSKTERSSFGGKVRAVEHLACAKPGKSISEQARQRA